MCVKHEKEMFLLRIHKNINSAKSPQDSKFGKINFVKYAFFFAPQPQYLIPH